VELDRPLAVVGFVSTTASLPNLFVNLAGEVVHVGITLVEPEEVLI
jgi:hypothetical protein